jgi:surface polysaccharide O-acyltransferase-like enzyme
VQLTGSPPVAAAPDGTPEGSVATPGDPATHLEWVDLARVAAILAVIAIHVASPLVIRPSHPTSWWFGNLVESAARWCVPVFVMISGALLLTSARTADPVPFYLRRFARLGPAMLVWIPAYLVFGHVVNDVPATLDEAARSVLAGRPFYHLYFLFVIAGLYLIAPWLEPLVARGDRDRLTTAVIVATAIAMADGIILVFGIGGPNAATRWLPFVGYFLAGALIRDIPATPTRIRLAAVVAVAGILATAIGTGILVGPLGQGLGRGRYLYEYPSVTTVPTSLAVFALLVWLGPGINERLGSRSRRLVASAAAASFGIYLVHPMILEGLSRLGLNGLATAAPIAVTVTIALAFVISWPIVVAMERIPGLRAIV